MNNAQLKKAIQYGHFKCLAENGLIILHSEQCLVRDDIEA